MVIEKFPVHSFNPVGDFTRYGLLSAVGGDPLAQAWGCSRIFPERYYPVKRGGGVRTQRDGVASIEIVNPLNQRVKRPGR